MTELEQAEAVVEGISGKLCGCGGYTHFSRRIMYLWAQPERHDHKTRGFYADMRLCTSCGGQSIDVESVENFD